MIMTRPSGKLVSLLVLCAAVAGCATVPTGPSVRVLPAPGKSFEQFMAEDDVCRQWASRQLGQSPQETANESTARSAVVGTAIGAGAGALLGAAAGNPAAGAAIGGGSGLLLGTASGAGAGEARGMDAQRRYDNTYVQCMYAKGNQIPGTIRRARPSRSVPPPPPGYEAAPPDYYPPGQ
jgi:hypothetical protein